MPIDDRSLKKWLLSQPEFSDAAVQNGRPYVVQKSVEIDIQKKTKQHERLWSRIFDLHYLQSAKVTDPEFDIGVWKSSYTAEAIPEIEMRQWVNETVERILKHCNKNTRVLEIGCGTGLLMYPLLPHIQEYIGIDSSTEALQRLISNCEKKQFKTPTQFFLKDASDLASLPLDKCDVVIINSVAQYFPSADFFLKVLGSLSELMNKDAIIFIGDVRSYSLQPLFNLNVLLHRLAPAAAVSDLKKSLADMVPREKETLYHPRFFHLLNKSFAWITSISTELKKGRFRNEMNVFRYDVTLKVKEDAASPKADAIVDWKTDGSDLERLEQMLEKNKPSTFIITDVANERLGDLGAIREILQELPDTTTLRDLKIRTEELRKSHFDLEAFISILKRSGYDVAVESSLGGLAETLTLKCARGNRFPATPVPKDPFFISECSNRPATADSNSNLFKKLQEEHLSAFPTDPALKEIVPVSPEFLKIFDERN